MNSTKERVEELRALDNIGAIIDERVHAMLSHSSVYSSDREAAQMRAEAERLAEDMACVRAILDDYSRLEATLAAELKRSEAYAREAERLTKENKQMSNSTAKGVVCCRCGKETLRYVVMPCGSPDDGDVVCVNCLNANDEWKSRAEKADAEVERDEANYAEALRLAGVYKDVAEKAEADAEFHRSCLDAEIGRRKEAEAELADLKKKYEGAKQLLFGEGK